MSLSSLMQTPCFRSLFVVVVLQSLGRAVAASLLVNTDSGPVQGIVRNGVRTWLGIPYAADTGGQNRWEPPLSPENWSTPRDGGKWGPGCSQGPNSLAPTNVSEDCLNVNVFAPLDASQLRLPVIAWFHGGSFETGNNYGAKLHLYDGSHLAARGVVIVGANYRLGAFGWLSVPGTKIRGNYGLMDQRFALRWVQRNAVAFNGDPARVTIMGESAGAMSVGVHMCSSKSAGLFSQAIMESNPAALRYKTQSQNGEYGEEFVKNFLECIKLKADDLVACLRKQDAHSVHGASADVPIWKLVLDPRNWHHKITAGFGMGLEWQPTIDDEEFPEQVQDVFAAGRQAKVPTLAGSNENEVLGLVAVYASGLEYDAAMEVIFGPADAAKIIQRYKPGDLLRPNLEPLGATATDFLFRCPIASMLKAQARAGQPAYVYRFHHPPSMSGFAKDFGLPKECMWNNKTCHGTELPWVWGNSMIWNFTSEEVSLAQAMGDFWTSFAKTGHPSSSIAGKAWAAYDVGDQMNIVLQSGNGNLNFTMESSQDLCSFWESIGYDHATAPPTLV